MTITARYPSRCASCGGAIHAGDRIEWSKGTAARHTKCSGAARKSTSSSTLPVPATGEQIVQKYDGTYEVGQTLHIPRVADGGGADGHYWTVIGMGSRRISEAENDCEAGRRVQWAHVRPATEDEAAPVAARVAEAAARKVAQDRLLAIIDEVRERGARSDGLYRSTPDGMMLDLRLANSAGSIGAVLGLVGDTLMVHYDTGYDDYRGVDWTLTDAALATEVRALS